MEISQLNVSTPASTAFPSTRTVALPKKLVLGGLGTVVAWEHYITDIK